MNIKQYRKKYYQEHKEKMIKNSIEHRKNNKERTNYNGRKYNFIKRRTNPDYLIKINMRSGLRSAILNFVKNRVISKRKDNLMNYEEIINKLKPIPKDIENYNLHHIKPLTSFIFVDEKGINEKEIKKAFSSENIQLLLKQEHINKHPNTLRNDIKINIKKRKKIINNLNLIDEKAYNNLEELKN